MTDITPPQAGNRLNPGDGLNKASIALIGMMGAGKTAVGRALAARLKLPFADSDQAIVDAARLSIPEIFERDGEAFFRARETEVITRLLTDGPLVMATGGGAWTTEPVREVIGQHAISVWLDPPFEVLWARVKGKSTRPLLQTADPRGTLQTLFAARAPIYALADIRFRGPAQGSVDETAEALAQRLQDWQEEGRDND